MELEKMITVNNEDSFVNLSQTLPKIKASTKLSESHVDCKTPSINSSSNHVSRPSSSSMHQLRKNSIIVVQSFWKSFRGVLFTALATLFFAINASIVKHLTIINPALIALFRYVGTLILATATLREAKIEAIFGPSECRKWIIFRALTGSMAMYLRYATVQLLPLANAIIITLSVPVFACVFGRLFLKEPCGIFHAIALVITLIGIAFTSKLDVIFNTFANSGQLSEEISLTRQMAGLACGLGSALANSLTIISLRKLKKVHQSVTMFNTGWIAAIQMCIITYFSDGFQIPSSSSIPWLLMIVGIFSYYGQMLFTKSLQLEEASIVAMMESSCDLVLAFVFQIFFFKQIPDLFTILGAFLVSMAVLLTSFRKFLPTLTPEHRLRRWFSFLLE